MVEYEYDAWGNITNITDTSGINLGEINPHRYRSYYYDSETGLYYLNSRYYNPDMGRFINADGIIGANQDMLGYNLYAYVSNNPINYSDPSGEWAENAIDFRFRGNGFELKTTKDFLNRPFCIAFAKDVIKTHGSNNKYAGYNATQIAAEMYAHAVMLYTSSFAIETIGKGKNTFDSSVMIDIDPGDGRQKDFMKIWNAGTIVSSTVFLRLGSYNSSTALIIKYKDKLNIQNNMQNKIQTISTINLPKKGLK